VGISKGLQFIQRKLVMETISEFTDVIKDRPGNTSVLQNDTTTTTEKSVTVSPRPNSLFVVDTIKVAVRKMLELKVIKPSESYIRSPSY
jgi:hypothetical protein